ncbi:MAG: hypothetical protein HY319_28425 [Armatimonadetes bacterium]|nr:hypothetical protein [Armatimonadota bacterium]
MIRVAVGYEFDRLRIDVEGDLDRAASTTLLEWLTTITTAAEGKQVLVDLRKAILQPEEEAAQVMESQPNLRLLRKAPG